MLVQNPNTPGVKIVEVSNLPPSIVQVSTGIPVFLGYTTEGPTLEATRITSFKEYQDVFGGPFMYQYTINASSVSVVSGHADVGTYFFYEAIQLYFLNGGGPCYIVSVAHCNTGTGTFLDKVKFTDGIDLVDKLDEPTLICFPEAVNLSTADYGVIANQALEKCAETQDKFAVLDTPKSVVLSSTTSPTVSDYRSSVTKQLSYGATYFPHLEVNINYSYDEETTTFDGDALDSDVIKQSANYGKAYQILHNAHKMILPPSSLVAGVCAKTDRERGVWKAPANVALQGVIKPSIAISDSDQELLNVDASTGKSINAIRSFAGKGTLIWGARTLDGNSNEWRYVPVRRLFITAEESIKKATSQFVFENNDAQTWVKVSSMIKSYLNGLWKAGGLMGTTPDEAYFVSVGLGTTMTTQDLLEGKMIVKVGLAAVRPAEFIILEFSHFMNQ